jgi:hypothetical protein
MKISIEVLRVVEELRPLDEGEGARRTREKVRWGREEGTVEDGRRYG